MAWAATCNDGSIGLLHTEPEFRRQGLAGAVVKELLRLHRGLTGPPHFYVDNSNVGSEALCRKMGFIPLPEKLSFLVFLNWPGQA